MNAVPTSSPPSGGGDAPADQSLDRRLTVLETRFDTILPTLATKADIEALRVEFGIGLERLRGEFRAEMQQLRAEVYKAIHDATKWTIGIFVTVLLGSNFAMFNAMKALIESSRPSIERRVAPEALPALPQR